MIENILLIFQFILLLGIIYFIFIKQNGYIVKILLNITLKAFVIYLAILKDIGNAEFAIYVGLIFILTFILNVIFNRKYNTFNSNIQFIFLFLVIILILNLSCKNKKEKIQPLIEKTIKLKIVPYVVLEYEKNKLLIGEEKGKKVYVYDLNKNKIIEKINTVYYPSSLAYLNNKIYVLSKQSFILLIYDTITKEKIKISTGGRYPSDMKIDLDKNVVYIANTGSDNVALVSLAHKKIKKKIPTGKWPVYLYLDKPNNMLYVACKYTNTVEVIDTQIEKHIFTKVHTGISPIKLIPINKKYITILNEWKYSFNDKSSIIIFNKDNYSIKNSLLVDGGIFDGEISKTKKYLYITNPLKDELLFLNLKTGIVEKKINLKNKTPKRLTLSLDKKRIYVCLQNSKEIIIIKVNDYL